MGISITRDEADRPTDPLRVPERAGFVRRWVRTRGYNQEGHMSRMQEAGYVAVERTESRKAKTMAMTRMAPSRKAAIRLAIDVSMKSA